MAQGFTKFAVLLRLRSCSLTIEAVGARKSPVNDKENTVLRGRLELDMQVS